MKLRDCIKSVFMYGSASIVAAQHASMAVCACLMCVVYQNASKRAGVGAGDGVLHALDGDVRVDLRRR